MTSTEERVSSPQFCPAGHDKSVVGTNNYRRCRECVRETQRSDGKPSEWKDIRRARDARYKGTAKGFLNGVRTRAKIRGGA